MAAKKQLAVAITKLIIHENFNVVDSKEIDMASKRKRTSAERNL